MAYRVNWLPAALEDIEEIATYIERDSPRYANAVVSRLVALARSLTESPLRGRKVPELADVRYREHFAYSYRMIYCVEGEEVQIVAVVHGRRLLESAMEGFSEKT